MLQKLKYVLFLVLAVIVVAAFDVSAFAVEDLLVTISTENDACVGEELAFTVKISKAKCVKSIAIVPEYDTESFELVSGEWLIDGDLADFSIEKCDGVIAMTDATDINCNVLRFSLRPKGNAVGKSLSVSCETVVIDEHSHKTTVESNDLLFTVHCHHILSPDGTKCIMCGTLSDEFEDDEHGHVHSSITENSHGEESKTVSGKENKISTPTVIVVSAVSLLLVGVIIFAYIKIKRKAH